MIYVSEHQAIKDAQSVGAAILLMSELAKPVINDGINITVIDLYNIAIGRKSLASVYQKEAETRSENLPAYRKEREISEALSRANSYQKQVDEIRNYMLLAKLKPESFKMNENCEVSFIGDLKNECIAMNTKTLTPKQESLVKGVGLFKKAQVQFNELLKEAGKEALNIQVPFTDHLGNPDLKTIAFIDFDAIQERKDAIQRQIDADIQKKEAIRQRIEKLVPKDYPDREETVNRFILYETTNPRPDEFYKNLLFPDRGNFKNNPK
jgi:hypothetical protein